jgi:acyl carrier protein
MAWTRETTKTELLRIVREKAKELETAVHDVGVITEETRIVGDLGLDSLAQMELMAAIEDHFEISIPEAALRQLDTVGEVVGTVERFLGESGKLAP